MKKQSKASAFAVKISDLFYPPKCVNCGEIIAGGSSRVFCEKCFVKYVSERESSCSVCGKSYTECFCRPKTIEHIPLVYGIPYDASLPVTRNLLLSVKHRKNKDVFALMAKSIVRKAAYLGIQTDNAVVTYIPRSPEKVIKYGFDQGEELARKVAENLSLPIVTLLRHKPLGREQKKLTAAERTANASASYIISPKAKKLSKDVTVIIVDDVITTGASMRACINALEQNGFCNIICFSAAKRDRHDEPQI